MVEPISASQVAIWSIAAIAASGVILRPWGLPEAIWAMLGAAALVAFALLPWREALLAAGRGTDVYLFLTGMMLLAELARREGLFDWLAAHAAIWARGSPSRLFTLVYVVGIGVTAFLSNDATAVVLTPAVYAVAKAAKAKPMPYLLVCAFIANAASFVLPISNPANLVLYGDRMPALLPWLGMFALPSAVAIAATYAALRAVLAKDIRGAIATSIPIPALHGGGRLAAFGITAAAITLLACSAFNVRLGGPTFLAGAATALLVLMRKRESPLPLLRNISWGIIPLVAGLFVLVEGLNRTGVIGELGAFLQWAADRSAVATAWGSGVAMALACNLTNNLPAGLVAANVAEPAHLPAFVHGSLLIGVVLGPNLSITGSLATILWLAALRREGQSIGAWSFLRIGMIVMPPALILSLGALTLLAAT